MLVLTVDPGSSVPVYLQIRDRVVALAEEGTLRPGDRLPPTRALAASLGVHRSTVVRAYEEIRALGYLESRPGSYSTVRRRARPPATATVGRVGEGMVDWWARATSGGRAARAVGEERFGGPGGGGSIDLERLAADPRLAPDADLRRCLRSVLVRGRGAVLDYADPAGWRPLREVVALRLRAHGVTVSAEEILITSGAQQALDLVLRMLTRVGDEVVVEAPTYGMAHALLRLHGLVPVEVPMADDGMDLEALETVLARRRAKVVYTMPNFHNPTGVTTSQAHRERLLATCERWTVPVVEDGFEEEMKYFGQAVLPIKSIDARGIVLYVGTFSKVVFPGLRVGWIAAPSSAIEALTAIQHVSCLSANTLAQAAAERFCSGGDFEAYLRRIHRVYRRRLQVMLEALATQLPPTVAWTRPSGGYTLWLTLPGAFADEPFWCSRIAEAGVRVAPGRAFFGAAPTAAHARLSISCCDDEQLREAAVRLGRALRA